MKRALTLATAGLFVASLGFVPMSVRADQAMTGGKDVKMAPSTTSVPGSAAVQTPASGVVHAPASGAVHAPASGVTVKPAGVAGATKPADDKKVTATPDAGTSTTTHTPGSPVVKTN